MPNSVEHRLHAEGAGFIGDDGDDPFAERLVLKANGAREIDEGHRGGKPRGQAYFWLYWLTNSSVGAFKTGAVDLVLRHRAAERLPAFEQIFRFRAVVGGFVEIEIVDLLVGQRQVKAFLELLDKITRPFFLVLWAAIFPSPASPRP